MPATTTNVNSSPKLTEPETLARPAEVTPPGLRLDDASDCAAADEPVIGGLAVPAGVGGGPDPSNAWTVWHRAGRKQPWRVTTLAGTKPEAARVTFDQTTGVGGDWPVTAPDAANPNTRPAHLRR